MTAAVARTGCDLIRTADDDEGQFFALAAAEAGFDLPAHGSSACVADRHPDAHVRVALRDGCVVGFYQLGTCSCLDRTAVLDYLYVHHAARRTGVGRALVDDLRRQAGVDRFGTVRIVAHPAAESFFHRVGAERMGTVSGGGAAPWSRPEFRVVGRAPVRTRHPVTAPPRARAG